MIKSKTRIEKQIKRKRNPEIVETIIFAKKSSSWKEIAEILSGSEKIEANLDKLEKEADKEKVLAIPGKVLSMGEIKKKVRVCALKYSKKAKEKLEKAGCEVIYLKDEILSNKDAKGVKIIK